MFNRINLLNPLNSLVKNPLKSTTQTTISQAFDSNISKDEATNLNLNSSLDNPKVIE